MFSRLCRAVSEDGARFTDAEIIDHMIFLMMAAHDTTTSTLTSMTYELARHPEWQERVREECRRARHGRGSSSTISTSSRALGWVMKETLRRYPPLPVIPRVATESFEFGGYEIPAGVDGRRLADPHPSHGGVVARSRSASIPERFAPARAEDERHTHSWVPFGGGPHLCIGSASPRCR